MITQHNAHHAAKNEDTVLSSPRSDDTVAAAAKKNQDAEISRLTWAVLDGKATIEQRKRLAELVNEQHREPGE